MIVLESFINPINMCFIVKVKVFLRIVAMILRIEPDGEGF